jgi:hypothetical protein
MKSIPLLIRAAEPMRSQPAGAARDHLVLDDDLPAVLDRDASGYILARDTYVTEVDQETTDDT